MSGGYDLNGKYYPNLEDAMNAEMVQCAVIDLAYTNKRIATIERIQRNNEPTDAEIISRHISDAFERIEQLEQRVEYLEQLLKK